MPKLNREALQCQMQVEFERLLNEVAEAVDAAPSGRLIRDSEEPVREAQRLDLRRADEKIANVDGVPLIRNELELHGVVDQIGLDFYHLSQHVEAARWAVYGEASETGRQGAQHVMHASSMRATDLHSQLQEWKRSMAGL